MNIYKNNYHYYNNTKINVNKLLIILNYLFIIFIYICNHNKKDYKNSYSKKLSEDVQKSFLSHNKVNINEIEQRLNKNNLISNDVNSSINIGFTLDPNFILPTMLTTASIMVTQNNSTKIIFHYGVTKNFNSVHMLKIYGLRNKLNNLTEFNFYYLKEATEKMQNFHPKGVACPGKFELPQLLPNDVKRLIIFDAGDVLILRDLSELYNYDMKNYWALGPPEPRCIPFVSRLKITKYINIGSVLLNVEEFKKNYFWDLFTKKKNIQLKGMPDQTLFNMLLPDNKKNFFPLRFGAPSIISNDANFDKMKFIDMKFKSWLKSSLSDFLPEKPKSEIGILAQTFNIFVV